MMKKFKLYVAFSFSILISTSLLSQEGIKPRRQISVGAGMSLSSIKDQRLSAKTQKQWSPIYEINYLKETEHDRQEVNFEFSLFFRAKSDDLFGYSFIRPNVSYSYQRNIARHHWMGVFISTNTLLSFPKTSSGIYNNNPISYTIASSIGPKYSWGTELSTPNGKPLNVTASAEAALLSYVIRPAYAHPYPTQYLKEGVFSPTQRGMAGPLIRSGRLQTISAHQSFKVKFGISYFLTNGISVAVHYQMDYYHNQTHVSSSFLNQDVSVRLSYHY